MGNILKWWWKSNNTPLVDEEYNKFIAEWSKIDRLKQKLLYFRNKRKQKVKLESKVFIKSVLEDPKLKIWDQPITKYYKFGKVLGLDRNSIVRQATLIHDPDFHVAVKAVSYNNLKGYYNSLLQEILALKQADHPSIVNLLEVYYDSENVYLVMEKIEGVTLHYIIDYEDKATEKDTVIIVEQLLKIVVYLNKINIAHWDIRPNNVLINPATLSLKLLDFGSSKYLVDEADFNDKIKEPLYSAPEMLIKKFNKKCDVWSIGIIAYHLLWGKVPFYAKKRNDLYKDIMKNKINFDNLYWMNRSKNALDFFSKILNPDPAKRISASNALKHPWIESMKSYDESEIDYDIFERCWIYNKLISCEACNDHSKMSFIKTKQHQKGNSKLIYQILDVIITSCKGKAFRRFDEMFKMLDSNGEGVVTINLQNNTNEIPTTLKQETLKMSDLKLK